jgi:uncharacterized membrane protein YhiD involved in acid resistance
MFDLSSLQYNSENPTLLAILFTVVLSFLLGGIIAFTYEKTTRGITKPIFFIQTLVLIAIVAATIMQAIGDSVARGLGMLGALSIIRFRTTLRNPRNIGFMFASLAAGISCGVLGFTISIVGTLTFCFIAVVLRFTPLSQETNIVGSLKIDTVIHSVHQKEVEKIINKYCSECVFVNYKLYNSNIDKVNMQEHAYKIRLKDLDKASDMKIEINQLGKDISVSTLSFSNATFDNI